MQKLLFKKISIDLEKIIKCPAGVLAGVPDESKFGCPFPIYAPKIPDILSSTQCSKTLYVIYKKCSPFHGNVLI